ncbi:MAG: tetratricopeptide repeat protein [Gemmatimonadaceae bacterium]
MGRSTLFGASAACCALIALGGGVAWHAHASATADGRSVLISRAYAADAGELELHDREIAFFERRAAEDPYSAGDQAELARRFLQRARRTGSFHDVLRAESAARRSLELRSQHNTSTYELLAASLLEQHRFVEARDAAVQLVSGEPGNVAFRAVLAETHLELGEYDAARAMFVRLERHRGHLDVAPRLARWQELTGRTDEARRLLIAARDEALGRAELALEQVAWFHLRVGDLELRNGRIEEAHHAFVAGLVLVPDDYRLLSAMARLEAARCKWTAAIDYAGAATAKVLDPATLAFTSVVYAAMNDSARSAEYATAAEVALLNATGAFHREENLFLLDQGRRIEEISVQAMEDVRVRRDVYRYDLLAWALHKQGRHNEAAAAMTSALRLGTRDAMLFYHAGMIERALGRHDLARRHLEQALEVNPSFHPAHAAAARRTLSSLRREASWRARLSSLMTPAPANGC